MTHDAVQKYGTKRIQLVVSSSPDPLVIFSFVNRTDLARAGKNKIDISFSETLPLCSSLKYNIL